MLRCQGTQYPVEMGRINTIMPGEYVMYLWSSVQRKTRSRPIGSLGALLISKLYTKVSFTVKVDFLRQLKRMISGSLCKFCQTHDTLTLQSARLKTFYLQCFGRLFHLRIEQFLVVLIRLVFQRKKTKLDNCKIKEHK